MLLAINTASSNTAIALFQKKKEGYSLLNEKTWKSHNNEAEKLMPEIDLLTNDEITEILVIKGPGSFTGLRVGVSLANAIAYLNKAKLYEINTFEYFWQASKDLKIDKDSSAVLVYAGAKGVYINTDKTETINIEDLNKHLLKEKITTVFGDISEAQKEIIEDIKFIEIKNSFGETIERLLNSKKLEAKQLVKPLYIKKPSITKSKKSLFK